MDLLTKVLQGTLEERSEYAVEILVLKDSEFAVLNLQVTYENELIHLKYLSDYDLRVEKEREQYKSDIEYLNNWFNVIIMNEKGE